MSDKLVFKGYTVNRIRDYVIGNENMAEITISVPRKEVMYADELKSEINISISDNKIITEMRNKSDKSSIEVTPENIKVSSANIEVEKADQLYEVKSLKDKKFKEVFTQDELAKFIIDKKLQQSSVDLCIAGNMKSHKGFTFTKLTK